LIPLWRPTLSATSAALVALPVDRHFRWLPQRSLVRWPLLALQTFVGCYLVFATPVLAAIAAPWLVTLAWRRRRSAFVEEEAAPSSAPRHALAATSLVFLLAMLIDRAATPYFWDAFVWLAKARYAAGGLEGLIKGSLATTLPPFIPSGYPLLQPMMVALLSGLSPSPASVVAGSVGLEILTLLLFLCAIADDERIAPRERATRLATVAVILLSTPLVVVHVRSSYVDLPLGLLIGVFALLLPRPGTGVACGVLAVVAAALKDEGMVHVVAITLVAVAAGVSRRRDEALVRRAIASGICAAAVMATWHIRVGMSGMVNADHALSLPHWGRVPSLARAVLDHALEVDSWGALAVLAVGGTIAVATNPRSAPRDAAWFATLLLADAVVLFVALLATPERVMEFAMSGTLLNRLAVQLAPLTALMIAGWIASDAEQFDLQLVWRRR
jgi:hypothetical protein